jgi:molybdopterin-binding protein
MWAAGSGFNKMKNQKPIFTAEAAKNAEIFLLFFLCGLGVLCGEAFCDELRFRFAPGDKFSLVSVMEQKTFSPGEPAQERGLAKGGPGDANQPKVPSQAVPLSLVLGESFYVRITPQGRIDRINGLQAIVSSARGKIPNMQGRGQIIQAVVGQMDEVVLKRVLEEQLAVFPDLSSAAEAKSDACAAPDEIKVGYTWSRSERSDEDKTVSEWTWRLAAMPVAGRGAVIDVNLIITPDANADEMMMGDVKARHEISGRGTGQIEIEQSTGRIIKSILTKDLVEEIKLSAQGLILRPPPAPEPTRTHIVTTFQMIKQAEGTGSKPAEPNQP